MLMASSRVNAAAVSLAGPPLILSIMTKVHCLRRSPARLIASNAGVEGEVIVEALSGQPFQMGYNAMDDRIEVRLRVSRCCCPAVSTQLHFREL